MTAMDGVQVHLVDTVDAAGRFMTWLGERRDVLAFDTETGGLEFWRQPLRLIQFGDRLTGWAIPYALWGGVALEAFKRYDGPLVAHNGKFDVSFIEHHAKIHVPWGQVHDTRVMAHLLDPTQSTALKGLATRLIDPKCAAGQDLLHEAMKQNGWTWATVPADYPGYWAYGALDTVLTAKLYEVLKPRVDAEYKDVYDLEMAAEGIIMGMERRGSRIDLDYCHNTRQSLADYVAEVHLWCQQEHGVNPGSNMQVTTRLKELGINLTKVTPTGNLALDEEVLTQIDHELARQVLGQRKATKILSTYFDNFLTMHDDGYLHPGINTLGARTGRMSMDRPALQTLPRGRVVRDAFIPRDGRVLLSADFDQIEMRLLAHFTQEQAMIDAIMRGDLHTETARLVYGDASIDKKDARRQLAKNAGFAKVYGAGLNKFAATAGVTVDAAKQFLDGYDRMFPGVRAFQSRVEAIARQRYLEDGVAWVKSPIGRRHPADDNKTYALVNYLIQGTAADVLKQTLVDLDLAGLGEYMLLPVHDEVIFDVPAEDCTDVAEQIRTTMTRHEFVVPLTCGVDGPLDRWGAKYA